MIVAGPGGTTLLAAVLERWLGLHLPGELELLQGPETIRQGGHHDYLADGTALLRRVGTPDDCEAFVVEVQLGEDSRKIRRWPLYVVGVHNRLGCPTSLVVVTDSLRVARWASRPIDLGRGLTTVRPLVLGPRQIPRQIDPQEAEELPALAVLTVVGHGRGSGAERIGRFAIEAVRPLVERDEDCAMLYMDVITAFLDPTVLETISEDEMDLRSYEPVSEFGKRHRAQGRREGREEGREEGRIQGMAAALLTVLNSRGFEVSERMRTRVATCPDADRLRAWLQRASTAPALPEVFAD